MHNQCWDQLPNSVLLKWRCAHQNTNPEILHVWELESRTGLPQAKQVTGSQHSLTHQQAIGLKIYWAALSDSMKLWAMPCRATQDKWVKVERSDKIWSTGEGSSKITSVFLPWEPHEQYEKAKRYDTERWTPQIGRCPMCYWRPVEK